MEIETINFEIDPELMRMNSFINSLENEMIYLSGIPIKKYNTIFDDEIFEKAIGLAKQIIIKYEN